MKEAHIRKLLRAGILKMGGLCQKFTSPATRDVPDELVTWPWGEMDLVETKKPGEKARPGQLRDHRERAALGVPVYLLDTPAAVQWYLSGRSAGNHVPKLWSVHPVKGYTVFENTGEGWDIAGAG
jgi:hypothetical protein